MESFSIPLRAVVYREGKWWLAHCLELDLVAEGATPDDALRDLTDLTILQIRTAQEDGNLEAVFRSAPAAIWRLFAMANPRSTGRRRLPKPIERFEAREYALN
jgi:hypothetical protein